MRLIDRDAIHWRPDESWELYATAADIRAIPIVDAVVVTRCKDCKHSYEDAFRRACNYGICGDCTVSDDFYCASGKPKEGTNADNHD